MKRETLDAVLSSVAKMLSQAQGKKRSFNRALL